MRSTLLWVLAAANALLLAVFVARISRDNVAYGQAAAAQRRVSEYLMIPGEVSGGTTGIVYIIDSAQGRLAAVAFDDRRGMDVMPPIDLNQVAAGALGNGTTGTGTGTGTTVVRPRTRSGTGTGTGY